MKNSRVYLIYILMFVSLFSYSQSSFFSLNSQSEVLSQRYEIESGNLNNSVFSDIRPYHRKLSSTFIDALDTAISNRSIVDNFNINYLQNDNFNYSDVQENKHVKPILKHFYKTRANFLQVNKNGFNLYVNPAFYFKGAYSDLDTNLLYRNTRAIEMYGDIDGKLGFYTFVSENQIKGAQHESDFVAKWGSYPGAHFTKTFENAYDFFLARGYISFRPIKSINLQFGQDRNFIGNGIRSLLLSDFATDYLFFKANTQVWRFNYMNLFTQLTDRYGFITGTNTKRPLPKKYVALHYFSYNITDNFNIGLFESVTFHDNNNDGRGFDINYMNPIIFYRAIEHQLGDPDKMMVGLNLNYLPVKNIQIYGQFMLNELRINDLRARNGHSANKFGYQIGTRYVNVAGISNLDLQVEYNRVRPYSYAHKTMSGTYPVNSYSHYNQPLAHPLGANFSELIVRLESQMFPNVNIGTELMYAKFGADSANSNWGGNIFLDYNNIHRELGNYVGQGVKTELLISHAWINYQIFHNLFVELDVRYRWLNSELDTRDKKNLFVATTLRLNLARTNWSF